MRSSKLWGLALLGWLWPALALAQLITPASMRDANLTTTSTQNLVTTLNTFSAQRTLTIPGSGGLSSYYFQFVDTANAINGGNTLRIVAADGALINGGASLTVSTAGAYVFIISSPSGYAATVVPPTASGGGGTPGGTSGQVQYNNSGSFGGFTTSGDLTINTATGAGTFATVNANVGAFGSNVNCTTYTVNAKGLITAASQTACTPAIGSVTGLGTGIATALAVNVGSAGAPILFNGVGGTPSSLVGTNITGTAAGFTAGNVTTNANLTGDVTSVGNATTLATVNANVGTFGSATTCITSTQNAKGLTTAISATTCTPAIGSITGLAAGMATFLATPTSANLAATVTNETGSGLLVFATSPTLTTPILGVAAATSINFGGTALSSYVEGTWTPTLVSSGGGTPTYGIQIGSYERIGRQVTIRFTLSTSAVNTLAAGALTIAGLPLTATATTNDNGACTIATYSGVTLDAAYFNIGGIIAPGATAAGLFENSNVSTSSSFNLQVGNIANFAIFIIKGLCIYHV